MSAVPPEVQAISLPRNMKWIMWLNDPAVEMYDYRIVGWVTTKTNVSSLANEDPVYSPEGTPQVELCQILANMLWMNNGK